MAEKAQERASSGQSDNFILLNLYYLVYERKRLFVKV